MSTGSWRIWLSAAGLAVAATSFGSLPAQAQNYSDAYTFLKAVKDRDGDKATELVNKPGSIVVNAKEPSTGDAPLHIVARDRDMTWLAFLLDKGAKPNTQNKQGNTPLMVVAQIGWLEGAQELIENGADADLPNDRGETPLILAVQNRDLPMARLLLRHGADPNRKDSSVGYSAIDYAKRDGRSPALLKALQDAATPAAH